ncbi:MAG: response regulator [Elusimicrobiales bacterium]|nr:response regulator [Elusimicrobiales bacterium]
MKKNILLIDDDLEFCEEMTDILSSEGYKTKVANDGKTGARLATGQTGQKYDVIVLDFKMPGLGGVDVLRALSRSKRRPKIILASGRPSLEQLLKDEKLEGMVDFIANKPFDPEVLVAKINTLCA